MRALFRNSSVSVACAPPVVPAGVLWAASVLLAASLLSPASAARAQPAGGDDAVRVLFIPGGTVPSRLRGTLARLLASRAETVSYNDYVRACAARNLRPSSRTALRNVATRQNATVIIVASYGGHYRRRLLRLRYHDGQSGDLITSSAHALRAQHLRANSQHAILRDLNQVTGGRIAEGGDTVDEEDGEDEEEPRGPGPGPAAAVGEDGLPPPLDWDAEEAAATGEAPPDAPEAEEPEEPSESQESLPLEEQRQWGFAVQAGGGVMHRTASIPTEAGEATLRTNPFPAIQAELIGFFRPIPSSRLRLELVSRYTTSVGLLATDQRADMTTRTTDMRAHHLTIGVASRIPLVDGERPTMLFAEIGWSFRMLDSEIAVSIPDYTLSGIYARVGIFFTLGDSPISLGLVPEIGYAGALGDQLPNRAQASDGVLVGGEAFVRLQIIREIAATLMYREAHAFLPSALGGEVADAERYAILRLEYRW